MGRSNKFTKVGSPTEYGTDKGRRIYETPNREMVSEKSVTLKIKVKRLVTAKGVTYKTCQLCNGTGQVKKVMSTMIGQMMSTSACNNCNGNGKVLDYKPPGVDSTGLEYKEEIISINIPEGVSDGMQLSMSGKGNDTPGGGTPGDLLILIDPLSPTTTSVLFPKATSHNAYVPFAEFEFHVRYAIQ